MKLSLFTACILIFALPPVLAQLQVDSPPPFDGTSEMKVKIDGNWLLLPMDGNERYNKVRISDKDGKTVFFASVLLSGSKAAWYAPVDVSKYKGQELVMTYQNLGSAPHLMQSDSMGIRNYSADRGRPAYHLTPKDGFMGEICGLVYEKGKWNAYFLYNPYAMTPRPPYYLARAASEDLINWTYEPNVSAPKFSGDSVVYPVGGSAYFDRGNRSGFFDSGAGTLLVVENSDGSTWLNAGPGAALSKLSGVGGKSKGSPTLTYIEDFKLWFLLKCENVGGKQRVNFYSSPDLKSWKLACAVDADFPSPSFRKMPVSGSDANFKYVLWSGDGRYFVGDFDGKKFASSFPEPARLFYGDAKSAQFWQNATSGRCLVSAWIEQPGDLMRTVGQSFSQCMSIPWEIRLADTKRGFRLRASLPVEVVEHMGDPLDALGIPTMQFRSNVFMLPNAVGNKFAVVFTFDTRELVGFSLRAGVAKFGYSKTSNIYEVTRIEDYKHIQKATDPRPDGFTSVMMFVDTYSVETFFLDGSAVLFMGDSYINPEQYIKIGCNGEIFIEKVTRIPILPTTMEQRAKAAREIIESVNSPKKKK